MNWALPGGGFHFGSLSPVQQTLYENQPDLAYRQLMNWWGQGQAGFENTVLGRFLQSQQQGMFNDYTNQAAANPQAGLTWTQFLENKAPGLLGQFQQLPGYMRGSNPGLFRVRRELW